MKTSPLHITPDGIFVYSTFSNNIPEGQALIHLQSTVANMWKNTSIAGVHWQIIAPDGKMIDAGGAHETAEIPPGSEVNFSREIAINSPQLWSPESPNLYQIIAMVQSNGPNYRSKEN